MKGENTMSIIEKLYRIQQEAVSPKDKDNDFGGFRYRNVEGILRNVKPIFQRENVYCKLSDEAVELNGSTYIKATATLTDIETGEQESSAGYAREMESKKGMDASQCTGCASTYARKYALCGLLGLDDSTAKPAIETDAQAPAEHDEEMALSRQTIIGQITAFGVTREELDGYIATKEPGKNADTCTIGRLRSIKKTMSERQAKA